jgi:hypothetical protein
MMKHVLGATGVAAAGVLLAVSAAMNWRFGFSLGKTELDGQIYGAASAAADCFKALVPFFFFAALRNKMWSQAAASAVVWVVVTAYSLTSALGHAALNRLDTSGQRAVEAATYKDLRSDLKRAEDQASWIPQHRPAMTVQAEIEGLKNQRAWSFTQGCTAVTGKQGRDFCQQFHALNAELASGQQLSELNKRIAGLKANMAKSEGATVMSEADPQAAVLAKLGGLLFPNIKVEDVQTALTIFVAMLLEVGSGFGMYVAFAYWNVYERRPVPVAAPIQETVPVVAAAPVAVQPAQAVIVEAKKPQSSANDNKSLPAPATKLLVPENDVERFYKERIETTEGSSVTASAVYEDYCTWCEEHQKEPLALPRFGREFGELGIQKVRIAGRTRYTGISLRFASSTEEDKKLPATPDKAAA